MIVGDCQEDWKTGEGIGGWRGECIHNTLNASMKLSKEQINIKIRKGLTQQGPQGN